MSTDKLHSHPALPYQQCNRCIMDTSAPDIEFDDDGVCNFCTEFLERSSHVVFENEDDRKLRLEQLLNQICNSSKGRDYDCVVGVSGGVDSSWVLIQAKQHGLRPLAVHMDNGWNSELAQSNIANLVNSLDVDLYTHVIDWHEYRDLMQAFFDADVIDLELLYDNAMTAVCYEQAKKYRVKYILSGCNQATEGMRMPQGWNWYKRDARNIKALARRFGNIKPKTFPLYSTFQFIVDEFFGGIRWISFLDFLPFNKFDALRTLENLYAYKPYPFKHYESIFTRFYQGYILPKKFGVDKRLLHLSTLIMSGQITREDALKGLSGIPYPSQQALDDDIHYFLKKMNWTDTLLTKYLERPEVSHDTYPSEAQTYKRLVTLLSPTSKKRLKNFLSK